MRGDLSTEASSRRCGQGDQDGTAAAAAISAERRQCESGAVVAQIGLEPVHYLHISANDRS
jgi:hypothetical protein